MLEPGGYYDPDVSDDSHAQCRALRDAHPTHAAACGADASGFDSPADLRLEHVFPAIYDARAADGEAHYVDAGEEDIACARLYGDQLAARDGAPKLRPLHLVSKYHESPQHTAENAWALPGFPDVMAPSPPHLPSAWTPSPPTPGGGLHGDGVRMESTPQGVSSPLAQAATSARGLRKLRLPGNAARVRIPHVAGTPEMGKLSLPPVSEADDSTLSTVSTHVTDTRPRRVPFSALHPRAPKRIQDPDAVKLFWFGFLGMPWLWLLGGWCLDDHGVLVAPWAAPSFSAYRRARHPYGPPLALAPGSPGRTWRGKAAGGTHPGHREWYDRATFGADHRGVAYLVQRNSELRPPARVTKTRQWSHVERFVLYNRIAAALSSLAIFGCWAAGIWAVVAHF
ncbi:hypothetical protein MSPP1_000753 [Malassezia sp. CBS 17886]|nr:hypothetical protein MSPP1_000753 [Malassezia sp. CBS 17886]